MAIDFEKLASDTSAFKVSKDMHDARDMLPDVMQAAKERYGTGVGYMRGLSQVAAETNTRMLLRRHFLDHPDRPVTISANELAAECADQVRMMIAKFGDCLTNALDTRTAVQKYVDSREDGDPIDDEGIKVLLSDLGAAASVAHMRCIMDNLAAVQSVCLKLCSEDKTDDPLLGLLRKMRSSGSVTLERHVELMQSAIFACNRDVHDMAFKGIENAGKLLDKKGE